MPYANWRMTMESLSLRTRAHKGQPIAPAAYPQELLADPERQSGGLPWLHGKLGSAAPYRVALVLQVHNRAGIPIVEGRCEVEAGRRQFAFTELRPIGIDAYAHKSEAERADIARRIWARHAYGTLTVLRID